MEPERKVIGETCGIVGGDIGDPPYISQLSPTPRRKTDFAEVGRKPAAPLKGSPPLR
jgi:hypothetical protein